MYDINKLFIGGLTSSGTTVVYQTLKELGFAFSTGKFEEGQRDPKHPDFMGKDYLLVDEFNSLQKKKVLRWLNGYKKFQNNKQWFIEKTPRHFACFVAIQDLFDSNSSFIVLKRDPFQIIASAIKRWNSEMVLIEKRLKSMIKFHNNQIDKIDNFIYVKYEDFCDNPIEELNNILSFLNIDINEDKIVKICNRSKIKIKHLHKTPKLSSKAQLRCEQLYRLWEYK